MKVNVLKFRPPGGSLEGMNFAKSMAIFVGKNFTVFFKDNNLILVTMTTRPVSAFIHATH